MSVEPKNNFKLKRWEWNTDSSSWSHNMKTRKRTNKCEMKRVYGVCDITKRLRLTLILSDSIDRK